MAEGTSRKIGVKDGQTVDDDVAKKPVSETKIRDANGHSQNG